VFQDESVALRRLRRELPRGIQVAIMEKVGAVIELKGNRNININTSTKNTNKSTEKEEPEKEEAENTNTCEKEECSSSQAVYSLSP